MDNSGRPVLGFRVDAEIEDNQNSIELMFWEQLESLLRPTPSHEKVLVDAFPRLPYRPTPKSPAKLLQILIDYASALFESEARFYPRKPELESWLKALGERVTTRVLATVAELEGTGKRRSESFEHHGVPRQEMRIAIATSLIATSVRYLHPIDLSQPPPLPPELTSQLQQSPKDQRKVVAQPVVAATRLSSTINSPWAARKMERFIESKGMSLTDFASRAQTTDRTLRNFRKTGKIRRDIFKSIANAMGITIEELLAK